MNLQSIRRRLLYCLLLVCMSPMVWAVGVRASLDRQVVHLDETVALTIELEGATDGQLNLQALQTQFQIFGTSRSSQIRIINGKRTESTRWTINLLAKQAGRLTIPSLSVAGQHTRPLQLQVKPGPAMTSDQSKKQVGSADVFFDVEVSPKRPYVNSQILYTLKLYYDIPIHNESLVPPSVPGVVVEPLGESRHYVAHHQGKPYEVFEQRFVLFPEHAGSLTIHPPVLSGMVENQEAEQATFGGFFVRRFGKPLRVVGPRVKRTVLAVPAKVKLDEWLPARSVTLAEQWSEETKQFKVGQPYTRTILLRADGVKAEQLPSLTQQSMDASIKRYPDKAKLENVIGEQGVIGERVEKIAYIPTKPGQFTLPAVSIRWWDVTRNKWSSSHLPAKQIKVLAMPETQTVKPTHRDNASTSVEASRTPKASVAKAPALQVSPSTSSSNAATGLPKQARWPFVALVIAVLVIIGLMLLLFRQRRQPVVSQVTEPRLSKKQTLSAIKKACQANDASACQTALLIWARQGYPGHTMLSLADLRALVHEEALSEQLAHLNEVLYQGQQANWSGELFWQSFSAFQQAVSDQDNGSERAATKPGALPPLNP